MGHDHGFALSLPQREISYGLVGNSGVNPYLRVFRHRFTEVLNHEFDATWLLLSLPFKYAVSSNAHVRPQFMSSRIVGTYHQFSGGPPKILRVVNQPAGYENEKSGEERNKLFSQLGTFIVSCCFLILGFHLQFATHCYVDTGRKLYGYSLLSLVTILGFAGPLGLIGGWWNRVLNFL